MAIHDYHSVKNAVLSHIQAMFQELEEEMAMSHQGKYTLLEDAFENAADIDELRVAFDQWYADQLEELNLEHDVTDLWNQALIRIDE